MHEVIVMNAYWLPAYWLPAHINSYKEGNGSLALSSAWRLE